MTKSLVSRWAQYRSTGNASFIFVVVLFAVTLFASIGNLVVPEASVFHVSTYTISLLGKYLCFALLAMSVDVIWGYCGILSLGHGAFFALGGYGMGMYLMRQK
jgi:urea transport system permease protein